MLARSKAKGGHPPRSDRRHDSTDFESPQGTGSTHLIADSLASRPIIPSIKDTDVTFMDTLPGPVLIWKSQRRNARAKMYGPKAAEIKYGARNWAKTNFSNDWDGEISNSSPAILDCLVSNWQRQSFFWNEGAEYAGEYDLQ